MKWGGERHGGVKITERKRHKNWENIVYTYIIFTDFNILKNVHTLTL